MATRVAVATAENPHPGSGLHRLSLIVCIPERHLLTIVTQQIVIAENTAI
ncbi:hypothetical Protein YC6258_05168 [Gynuella sunshinyii YC6258]|uniref:Uncharacterized protein n=1 Tax=Gynuella sunshinyii YC6258 TaxID=1445510 RepID=A0A0C5VV77_9GAMM|nr:hypothetical Protein YC6258_05168 [Gynuella sunshinyii YC6258]